MNEENLDKYVNAAKTRLVTVRLRTWTLTLAIIVSLVFYLIVQVTTKQAINWVDFMLLCIMQIVAHSIYFPDGDLFGQKDVAFISNKNAYNEKATEINNKRQISALREYCQHEFEERKERYILNECGYLGITYEDFLQIKQKSEKEIKKLKCFISKTENGEDKMVFFNKSKRKKIYALIFKRLPVQYNYPETILSAVENDGNKAIKDGSIAYKTRSYIRKILIAVIVGGIFAYIGYQIRDGFGLTNIVNMCMYLTTLFTTSVMAYTSGENCSKVFKSQFYVELVNFIDAFNDWKENTQK